MARISSSPSQSVNLPRHQIEQTWPTQRTTAESEKEVVLSEAKAYICPNPRVRSHQDMEEVKDKAKGIMKKLKNPFGSSRKFKGEGHRLGSGLVEQKQQQQDWRKSQQERWEAEQQRKAGKSTATAPSADLNTSSPVGVPPVHLNPVDAARRSDQGKPISSTDGAPQSNNVGKEELDVQELELQVATFLSGEPSDATIQVVTRLLRNIIGEPSAEKFRSVRLSNPKIQETVGSAAGGVEFLYSLGFRAMAKENETWLVMEEPSPSHVKLFTEALRLLEIPAQAVEERQVVEKSLDRQVRVFYISPGSTVAHAELPEEFYELSLDEVKKFAAAKRKKLEDSQLLIPKSYKAKQVAAARQKYKFSLIRVQFPDDVVLQGVFLPKEPTSAIYAFVRSALKTQVQFELVDPAGFKDGRIVSSLDSTTLDQAQLVPSALLKFQSSAPDFSGLRAEYLATLEPLTPFPF